MVGCANCSLQLLLRPMRPQGVLSCPHKAAKEKCKWDPTFNQNPDRIQFNARFIFISTHLHFPFSSWSVPPVKHSNEIQPETFLLPRRSKTIGRNIQTTLARHITTHVINIWISEAATPLWFFFLSFSFFAVYFSWVGLLQLPHPIKLDSTAWFKDLT